MKITTQPNQISAEALQEELKKRLPGYEIYPQGTLWGKLLIVKKSSFVGAAVWIREKSISVNAVVPSMIARVLLGGLLLMTVNYFASKKIVEETGNSIRSILGELPL